MCLFHFLTESINKLYRVLRAAILYDLSFLWLCFASRNSLHMSACGRTRAARAHTAHTRDFRHIRLKRSHRGRWDAVFLLGSRGCDTSLIYPSKYPQQKGVPPEIGQISGAAVALNAQREHRGLVK